MRAVRGGTGTRGRAEVPTSGEAADRWSRTLRRRGAVVLAAFSVLWVLVAASGVAGAPAWGLRGAGLVVALVLVALAHRPRRARDGVTERLRSQPAGWRRLVGRTNVFQAVVIVLVVLLGALTDVPQVVAPLVAVVVGVHFLPLARAFDQPEYRWTGAGMAVAGAVGIGLLVALVPHDVVRVVVGALAALSLWATAGRLALRP
ncbi:hypothetical protein WDZ17_14920 [Pseudokineococcus basanitobsidens]|uniref:Uncharacterized protein n=1 Tax=Pseudokineococcus basanitobsidens TaxID=1926649 RepID=A0ABU8RNJ3_9ACTN